MGIRLDWEIEADQARIQRAGEDPEIARRRRRGRLRLLLFILVVVALLAGAIGLVSWRLQEVDGQIAQLLRNTVDAEVAALRIGDENAFMVAQRSASDEWTQQQSQLFEDYQQRKLSQDIQLTGQISDVTIDDNRARVNVQEIIDSVPYTRVWFYWRYDDGWRHVPPDYTFWGDVETYQGQGVSVRYQTVDEQLSRAIGARTEQWLATACTAISCEGLPEISFEVLPAEGLQVSWSANNPWLLQIPSPYISRARSDMPFDLTLQSSVGNLLAERLVTATSSSDIPQYPSDASYLRQAAIDWLAGKYTQLGSSAFVIDTLAQNYGGEAVGRLLQFIQPGADARILAQAAGVPSLDQLNVDWRDFLTWRLGTEDDLIRNRDEGNFLNLYDTRDENVRYQASQRFASIPPDVQKSVITVTQEYGGDGLPVLRAIAQVGEGDGATQIEVLFRLVDGAWRRAN